MNTKSFFFTSWVLIAGLSAVSLQSCNDDNDDNQSDPDVEVDPVKVYLSSSSSVNTLVLLNTRDSVISFGTVKYDGTDLKQGEIRATMAAGNNALVTGYNSANNTQYSALPSACYELNHTTLTIEDGKNVSPEGRLTVKNVGQLDEAKTYLLPVTIQSISAAEHITPDDAKKTAYWVINYSPAPVLPVTISLNQPAISTTIDLTRGNAVTFSWNVDRPAEGGYILSLSASADLAGALTFNASETSVDVPAIEIASLLSASRNVYWSVKPANLLVEANIPDSRIFTIGKIIYPLGFDPPTQAITAPALARSAFTHMNATFYEGYVTAITAYNAAYSYSTPHIFTSPIGAIVNTTNNTHRIFSFEYKSSYTTTEAKLYCCVRYYMEDDPKRNFSDLTMAAATEWTRYEIDLTPAIDGTGNWAFFVAGKGASGIWPATPLEDQWFDLVPRQNFDPYEISIRNIQVELW
ncbi:MAG: DUF1735 domain-containing protein [Bacteroidales bacterium]|jgi:hypothetical protein|nr:DUF1735 domain-containing protein [Bacteroidales bacterium]